MGISLNDFIVFAKIVINIAATIVAPIAVPKPVKIPRRRQNFKLFVL